MYQTLFLNIERIPYTEALSHMRDAVEIKRNGKCLELLMLLEHDPVLTMGRASVESDILVSDEVLVKKGISIHTVERGGLVTYHGPGQIVAYPVFNLRVMGIGVVDLVWKLEEVLLNALLDFNIKGCRKKGFRGIWTGDDKIASIGVAVRGGISYHGFALNYNPDISCFDLINPCGLNNVRMTSMSVVSGEKVDASILRDSIAFHFSHEFNLELHKGEISDLKRLNLS
jgi:lipoate-protein ligase B